MKILGIDTSTSVASVALMDDQHLIGEMTLNDKKTHSQKLMLLIEKLLMMADTKLEDLDAIAVGIGPGSFTGLRIGVTTAKGLAHGIGIPVLEVSSLEALANNICMPTHVCAMMDSRRDTVFTSIYGTDGSCEEQVHIDEVIEQCQKYSQVAFVGDGSVLHRHKLSEALGEKAIFAPKHLNLISAGSLCEIALRTFDKKAYDEVHVTYLRKSQAEREYDERQK